MLAQGASVTDTAKAVGISREALSRRLNAPGSSLAAEVERRRGALATGEPADKSKALLEQAMAVLEGGLTSSDPRRSFEAAKAILTKLAPSQQVVKVEAPQAEPVTPEQAVRELAAALADAVHLIAEGGVSSDAMAMLTDAAARLVVPQVARKDLAEPPTNKGLPASPNGDARRPHVLQ
jgi:hypothetical protein